MNPGNPDNTWTTFDKSHVDKALADFPGLKFQYRLIGPWIDAAKEQR